ncbi:MAG: L-alanine-DL-glutamate epimerase [Candidatus Latescibacterota bacterium]|nr:L-alanine-DL-glutamate epimerase [Candidatus Latescibacterota bacterium]
MKITETDLEIQREPFARPFGFKGSAFHEKWNMIVRLRDEDGSESVGVGGLAVLWSDANVFNAHTEVGGNLLQASILESALQHVKSREYADPPSILADVLPKAFAYGRTITGNDHLRLTFVLIALVALDNAAWLLFSKQNDITTFDGIIPPWATDTLSHRQDAVATVPAVGYTLPMSELEQILQAGAYVLKIKIGHIGDQADMVTRDKTWLSQIHDLASNHRSAMTESENILYYLDANGRYTTKSGMRELLEHADRIGALERIILIEEPFDESVEIDVSDLPARFAADESVHTVEDVHSRATQGYGGLAIKPAGKTLSFAFEMVQVGSELGMECFVADNGCVPLLVEWNKNIAARLQAFPGLRSGLMESNGPENYATWDRLISELPIPDSSWLKPKNGAFRLDQEYYARSGNIFEIPESYANLIRN